MAIPFFEPRNTETIPAQSSSSAAVAGTATSSGESMIVDQVDGPATMAGTTTPSSPSMATTTAPVNGPNNSSPNADGISAPSTSSASSSSEEVDWKQLAVAMCKVMQDYYVQNASTNTPFTSAVVQITPNGQVKPIWK